MVLLDLNKRMCVMQNELSDLENEWLRTDERIDAVSSFEMFSEQLKQVIDDSHR